MAFEIVQVACCKAAELPFDLLFPGVSAWNLAMFDKLSLVRRRWDILVILNHLNVNFMGVQVAGQCPCHLLSKDAMDETAINMEGPTQSCHLIIKPIYFFEKNRQKSDPISSSPWMFISHSSH